MATLESFKCAGAPFVIGTAGPTVLHESKDSLRQQVEIVLEDLVSPVRSESSAWLRFACSWLDRCFGLNRQGAGRVFRKPLQLQQTPLMVLTSLAPGADTEIACFILDWCERHQHPVELVVALPFPPAVYEQVSRSYGASADVKVRQRFHDLLDRASQVFTVRRQDEEAMDDAVLSKHLLAVCKTPANATDEQALQAENARAERYELAASYVATFCDLLLAFCTPEEINLSGGTLRPASTTTSRCIAAKLHGEINLALPSAPVFAWAEDGPVVWIEVVRLEKGAPAPEVPPQAGAPRVQFAFHRRADFASAEKPKAPTIKEHASASEDHLVEIAARLEEFNRTFLKAGDHLDATLPTRAEVRAAAAGVRSFHHPLASLTYEEQSNLPEVDAVIQAIDSAPAELRALFDLNLRRSRVARMERPVSQQVTETVLLLFMLIGGAAALLHLYSHGGAWSPAVTAPLITLALMLAGMAWLVHKWLLIRRSEVNSLDWRAIAEGMRVQLAWAAAGLSTSVPSCYLHRFRSELDWVRNALSAWSFPYARWRIAFEALKPAAQILRLRAVGQAWIKGQMDYYQCESRKRRHSGHHAHSWGIKASLLGIVLLGSIVLCGWTCHHFAEEHHLPHLLLLLGAGFSLLIGALLMAHSEKSLNAEHARRYHGMFRLMQASNRHLETILDEADAGDDEVAQAKVREAQALLEALGREALTENAEWLLLHRARPVELPTAG